MSQGWCRLSVREARVLVRSAAATALLLSLVALLVLFPSVVGGVSIDAGLATFTPRPRGNPGTAPTPTLVPPASSPLPVPTIAASVLVTASPAGLVAAAVPVTATPYNDPRYFPQTGYRVSNDAFWDYFVKRGGVRTFGYPVSNEFLLLGSKVQIFQRQVLQLTPQGVTVLNLLDEGFLPYTRINGSTFPPIDKTLTQAAPSPDSPGYSEEVLRFVAANAPDRWNNTETAFYTAFLNTVQYLDAFPSGGGDPSLMPAINLELWGIPTSRPTEDPNNHDFVYLRFQRGIMHYDKKTGITQGLLLADYFKAIITGENLPPDLAQQAVTSPFYLQYDPTRPLSLARPNELPGTDLTGAFHSLSRDLSALPAPPAAPPAAPAPAQAPAPVQAPAPAVGAAPGGSHTGINVSPTPAPPPTIIEASNTCHGDEVMTFSPGSPSVGDQLLIAVSSAKGHAWTRLTGPGNPTFVQEREGQLGHVWEWTVQLTEGGRHDYTFYIDSTVVCTTNFVRVKAPTPTPAPTEIPGAPIITRLNPSRGEPGTQFSIVGNNFRDETGVVQFGDTNAEVLSWSNQNIRARVPENALPGENQVFVQTIDGNISNAFNFNVQVRPDPNNSTVEADTDTAVVRQQVTFTVQLLDRNNNPVPNVAVRLESNCTARAQVRTVDQTGFTTFRLTETQPGTCTYTATALLGGTDTVRLSMQPVIVWEEQQ